MGKYHGTWQSLNLIINGAYFGSKEKLGHQQERGTFRLANSKDAEEISRYREKGTEMVCILIIFTGKNILGQLENTGYCFPGKECLYNISIMEERQTYGWGVGAGSKFVNSKAN